MPHINTEIPVKLGNTQIMLPAIAWYINDGGYAPTEIDPGEPPIELRRIVVHVNDVDIDVAWTDDFWVDDLISEILDEQN